MPTVRFFGCPCSHLGHAGCLRAASTKASPPAQSHTGSEQAKGTGHRGNLPDTQGKIVVFAAGSPGPEIDTGVDSKAREGFSQENGRGIQGCS